METLSFNKQSEDAITHGMCEECANKIFTEIGIKSESFLDDLAAATGRSLQRNGYRHEIMAKRSFQASIHRSGLYIPRPGRSGPGLCPGGVSS